MMGRPRAALVPVVLLALLGTAGARGAGYEVAQQSAATGGTAHAATARAGDPVQAAPILRLMGRLADRVSVRLAVYAILATALV